MNAAAVARGVIDANQYLVLGTADAAGQPWTTPVYFAHRDYREFFWLSAPDRTHSHNLTTRRAVAVVIFDSQAPINTGQGVYVAGLAEQVDETDVARAIEIFSARCLTHGGRTFSVREVTGQADLRLYHAIAEQHWILANDGGPDRRIPVDISAR
jgi:nitroimidazol reductase NimA-like FMN-containing flavoprotein (pyridoxamine 5'-phosphate oxidase superfamily)